jgi:hypothetical protein
MRSLCVLIGFIRDGVMQPMCRVMQFEFGSVIAAESRSNNESLSLQLLTELRQAQETLAWQMQFQASPKEATSVSLIFCLYRPRPFDPSRFISRSGTLPCHS